MDDGPFVPFELCDICEPDCVWLLCMEASVQDVFCDVLWIAGASGAALALVFDGRFDISGTTDTKHSFVVDVDTIVTAKVVFDATITLLWMLGMNGFDFLNDCFVLMLSVAHFSTGPFIVGAARDVQDLTAQIDGIDVCFMAFLNSAVYLCISYFR